MAKTPNFATQILQYLGVYDLPRATVQGFGVPPTTICQRRRGKQYPEQSARQSMHGYRRAQGGGGLTEGTPRPMARAVFCGEA